MPKDTPLANIEEGKIVGIGLTLVDGLISDAARMAGVKAAEEGWFDLSTFKEPYRTEGKKIMGYELAGRGFSLGTSGREPLSYVWRHGSGGDLEGDCGTG